MLGSKSLLQQRFNAHFSEYQNQAFLQKSLSAHLAQLLQNYQTSPPSSLLEIGVGTGFLTQHWLTFYPEIKQIYLNDISSHFKDFLPPFSPLSQVHLLEGDAELLSLPKELDLIASSSTLQWFENPEQFFIKAHQSLKEGGLFALSCFGSQNFREIKALTGIGLEYLSLQEWEALFLRLDFELLHAEEQILPLRFSSPKEVLLHIKKTGVNGIATPFWTKNTLQHFYKEYETSFRFPLEGTETTPSCSLLPSPVSLTYHPLFFLLQKKRSS